MYGQVAQFCPQRKEPGGKSDEKTGSPLGLQQSIFSISHVDSSSRFIRKCMKGWLGAWVGGWTTLFSWQT